MGRTDQRHSRAELLRASGEEPSHEQCGECPRCTSGTGRLPTRQQDCWDIYLTETVGRLAARRSA